MKSVAAYCRVSTDGADQASSFDSQKRFFDQYIRAHAGWTLYRIYADEGISGTSTRHRAAFLQMLEDARAGKFQLILAKEVSRFSRNILDTIAYTRELKRFDIGVCFLNDGIHTLDADAELRLSIMASLAQEESRRTSSRVKWGQQRRMEQGVVFGRAPYGYLLSHGVLDICPEEAEVVRRIFCLYGLERKSVRAIAHALEAEGIPSPSGHPRWSAGYLVKLLRNEKYVGDLVQKKTITPDYLSHARRRNCGEEPLVILREHHPPIVPRALWERVQEELSARRLRAPLPNSPGRTYPLSGKICCARCGAPFLPRQRTDSHGSVYRRWSCQTPGCRPGITLREEQVYACLRQALATLPLPEQHVAEMIGTLLRGSLPSETERLRLERELAGVEKKLDQVLDACFSGQITQRECDRLCRHYRQTVKQLQTRLKELRQSAVSPPDDGRVLTRISALLRRAGADDEACLLLLAKASVGADRRLTLQLTGLPYRWTFWLPCRRMSATDGDAPSGER